MQGIVEYIEEHPGELVGKIAREFEMTYDVARHELLKLAVENRIRLNKFGTSFRCFPIRKDAAALTSSIVQAHPGITKSNLIIQLSDSGCRNIETGIAEALSRELIYREEGRPRFYPQGYGEPEILSMIAKEPGIERAVLLESINIPDGTISYHLQKLTRDGVIHTEGTRRSLRYYPGPSLKKNRDINAEIITLLEKEPGLSIAEISRKINSTYPTIYIRVNALISKGTIVVERKLDKSGHPVIACRLRA